MPQSMGGTDDLSNLITLCDGCHGAHHPTLSAGLARRAIERWAVRLARLVDFGGEVPLDAGNFGPVLRLFGAERFRDGQLAVVQAALSGKSILVVRPTGSGKTLCFQAPAVLRPGPTIVVSPLKALMAEQVATLLRKKVPATFINGDLSKDEKSLRYDLIRDQAIKLIHLAPERFFVRSAGERASLQAIRPAFLVIDEAHCVDQWGRDFRPEYGRLAEIRQALGNPPVLAFTATAGTDMQTRILHSLGAPDAQIFVSGVDRPNIGLMRWESSERERSARIADLVSLPSLAGSKALVLVPSTRVGLALQQDLKARGLTVPFYHSQHGSAFEREQLVKRLTNLSKPHIDVMISTSALGMGLDIPRLRLLIHWQHPASLEDYLQEFGRAGRDGSQAIAVMLHEGGQGNRDVHRLQFMAEKTVEDLGDKASGMLRHRSQQISKISKAVLARRCFRQAIVSHFQSERPPRRRLSTVILDWAFSKRQPRVPTNYCCDFCDRSTDRLARVADLLAMPPASRQP